jgi:phosphoenolpyruvate carboxylase
MSTQHPDNINIPFFSNIEVLAGDDEVKEAFYVFSQLGCAEQMWDSEGKEVDSQVVEKLLTKYETFFQRKILGKDIFLTYRVPNPAVQREQGKILLETLHSIPRAYDAAKAAGIDVAPIFEVILPMTTSHFELTRIKDYYEKVIVGQKDITVGSDRIAVKEWVGEFKPETINVIPLFENYEAFIDGPNIVEKYLEKKNLEYQRVFLARSDPALNYGSVSAVLLAKCALQRLYNLEEKLSIDILPILGVGSAPFRGNFRPDNVSNCCDEYPSVQTFTIQSSFKYDHPFRDVVNAIDILNLSRRRPPLPIDEKQAFFYINKIKQEYQKQIVKISGLINTLSSYIPARRTRKLHIGLFGYSRSLKGIKLPRAINFCGALYSIGLPPELIGLSALSEKEFDQLHEIYTKLDEDLRDSASYVNKRNIQSLPKEIATGIQKVLEWIDYEENEEYVEVTGRIFSNLRKGFGAMLAEDIKRAAWMRRFLG